MTANNPTTYLFTLMLLLSSSWGMAAEIPAATAAVKTAGPLKQYISKADDSYGWVVKDEGKLGEAKYAELILTSQTWKEITWKHQLFVIIPSSVKKENKHALLYIAGGSWKEELETKKTKFPRSAAIFAAMAEKLNTPIAILLQVPQQPIFDGKYEDQIIAFTFEKYLKTGDEEWPLLLPMVKSAIRGMDATQAYCKKSTGLNINTFTVTGASKRGWTTWLTAAVDKRVTAFAPIVIDVLNMQKHMEHARNVWGGQSEKISDYTDRGLIKHLSSEKGQQLRNIIDPYHYREQLLQPKLLIIGTNDRYWPLDSLNLYWKDIKGSKYILYVPNNRHGIRDYGRVIGTLNALHQQAANGFKMPNLSWKFDRKDGKLQLNLQSDIRPTSVRLWSATTETRDFREATWTSKPMKLTAKVWQQTASIPADGSVALFGEAVFSVNRVPYYLSTNVSVTSSEAVGK